MSAAVYNLYMSNNTALVIWQWETSIYGVVKGAKHTALYFEEISWSDKM